MSKVSEIYDNIDKIYASRAPNTDDLVAAQYDQLRVLNASYSAGVTAPDGTKYPSPEAFAFTRKDPTEQLRSRTEWAELPPSYLSEYQLNTTYGIKPTAKTAKYMKQEKQVQDYFDAQTKGLSHSSNEWDTWVKWREQALSTVSQNIGGTAEKIRKLEHDIPVGRMQAAGILPDNKYMNWIVDQARAAAATILASGNSLIGTSQTAQYWRGAIEGYIDQMRNPDSDYYNQDVDTFFRQQTKTTGITDQNALYREILWGVPAGFYLKYDFTYENETAAKVG
jgi:hypothetical protein